jgi:hypothetical protein
MGEKEILSFLYKKKKNNDLILLKYNLYKYSIFKERERERKGDDDDDDDNNCK